MSYTPVLLYGDKPGKIPAPDKREPVPATGSRPARDPRKVLGAHPVHGNEDSLTSANCLNPQFRQNGQTQPQGEPGHTGYRSFLRTGHLSNVRKNGNRCGIIQGIKPGLPVGTSVRIHKYTPSQKTESGLANQPATGLWSPFSTQYTWAFIHRKGI